MNIIKSEELLLLDRVVKSIAVGVSRGRRKREEI